MLTISWEVPSLHANRKKCLKQLAWISYNDSDNRQAFITKCDMLSRHIRQWNLKKTKSSKRRKLKSNFIHIDCFAVQTMVENTLPAFSTTINLLRHKNDQADMKKHDYLSFSFSSVESKHSVVYNHVKKCLFYKWIMQFLARAFESALVLWTDLWTSSIRLQLCKVRLIFLIFDLCCTL